MVCQANVIFAAGGRVARMELDRWNLNGTTEKKFNAKLNALGCWHPKSRKEMGVRVMIKFGGV